MARKKEYTEEEVLEKAMEVFWQNGYEATSTRMLEKEMGINQFSMYSSFGNKQGIFLESIKLYTTKVSLIVDKMEESTEGIVAIKQYFHDFVEFTRKNDFYKGCLIVNTIAEFGHKTDALVMSEVQKFLDRRDQVFTQKLEIDLSNSAESIAKQVNFLSIALAGLAVSSKAMKKQYLDDFIESTIENL
jgi:TetR/AcrR family transcriptional repressor of nem operon